MNDLMQNVKHNKRSLDKVALQYGISDSNLVKELTELALVNIARSISLGSGTVEDKYNKIVDLYELQPTLNQRVSQTYSLGQFSTPAPLAYIGGVYCELYKDGLYYEPCAGNGMLTIAGKPENFIVNELDRDRYNNLKEQNFKQVLNLDATKPVLPKDLYGKIDAIIMNPPFGSIDTVTWASKWKINKLEFQMSLLALETLKDTGKSFIIVGGHTPFDSKGYLSIGGNSFYLNYLYNTYNVIDIINLDKDMYIKQGTSFPVRIILINGRKAKPEGFAPQKKTDKDLPIKDFATLYNRIMNNQISKAEQEALDLKKMLSELLSAPYFPGSQSCFKLDTIVPDSMAFEMKTAIQHIIKEVGNVDEYVIKKLKFRNKDELCKALAVEQVDAVAMAIYNIEVKKQGMIIGDQTGIGKGRVAAALIRYAVETLHITPIFMTEKTFLFSDIYRDLNAIGCKHYKPFITNSRGKGTTIKDENGAKVYMPPVKNSQDEIIASGILPDEYSMVFTTYSQYNSPLKRYAKPAFLKKVAKNNIIIMDEAHNSSGDSNTGKYMQNIIQESKGILFLSATFAKRPDNMPVYALKTCISEANMTSPELVEAITKGGVALQEILSSQLVLEGQMIRRQRSYEGIEVNYIYLDEQKEKHSKIVDDLTEILRDIIDFQRDDINDIIHAMDDQYREGSGVKIETRKGTNEMGITNTPFASKVFNVINQMLFALKADEVADRAIARLKEGKKPIIAFASTMESFLEYMKEEHEMPDVVEPGEESEEEEGDFENEKEFPAEIEILKGTYLAAFEEQEDIQIPCDFSTVLTRALDGVLRYTEIDLTGARTGHTLPPNELPTGVQADYKRIYDKIKKLTTNIYISPIDLIVQKIREAGYTCEEITGRKHYLQINRETKFGMYLPRKKPAVTDTFRKFNDNEIDCILINQSGSTGASAHAVPTPKVPANKVKQRVMLVLQAELNINTEIQKRGRINRTGQILKPIYDYIISAIPAEQRLMMMLQKKLKSLDANIASDQKSSSEIMDVPDFLNKIGDKVVLQYLIDNPGVNATLNDPLHLDNLEEGQVPENAAHKVSGKVAILPTQDQETFYAQIFENYNNQVEFLKQIDEYDLEVETLDLQAKTLSKMIVKAGKGGSSLFGDHSFLEVCEVNVLKKPYTTKELSTLVDEALKGLQGNYREEIVNDFEKFVRKGFEIELANLRDRYEKQIANIPNEKKILELPEDMQDQAIIDKEEVYRKNQKESEDFAEERMEAKINYLNSFLEYFYIGQKILFPIYAGGSEGFRNIVGICLGIQINKDLHNPYAPSSVKIRFAISNSLRYIVLTCSGEQSQKLLQIKGASSSLDMDDYQFEDFINQGGWSEATKVTSKNRETRAIITGNIIQAFTDFAGKLISFTTADDKVRKGIFMPEEFKADPEGIDVQVPIVKILSYIEDMQRGDLLETSIGLFIKKEWDTYKILVPGSWKGGSGSFLDQKILDLVENGRFEKVGQQMIAQLPTSRIKAFVEILQEKNVNVTLTQEQFKKIEDQFEDQPQREQIIPLKIDTKFQDQEKKNIAEAEAEALLLELELLTIN